MNTPVTYSRNGGINVACAVGIVLLALFVGLTYRSITSGESMSGREIPAGPCTTVAPAGSSRVEDVVRQAVAQLAPNSDPTAGEPRNMTAVVTEALDQNKGLGVLQAGTPVTVCPKFDDPSVIASVGINNHTPVNLGGR